jgi:CheY-like chemotaxis protein/PAS domain-containing protein
LSAKTKIIFIGSLSEPGAEPLRFFADVFDVVEVSDAEEAARRFGEGGFVAILSAEPAVHAEGERSGPDGDARILENLPVGVCLVDAEDRLVWVNARFCQLCGRNDVLAQGFYAALDSPEILGPDFSPLHTALATGEPSTTKLQVREKSFFQLHVSPISGLGTSGAKLVVVVRDITPEVHQQQKLEAIHRAGIELTDLRPDEIFDMTVQERIDLLKSNILHHTQAVLDFNVVEVRLLDQATGQLTPLLAEGLDFEAANRALWARTHDNGVTGFVAATGEGYLCEETREDPLYLQAFAGARSSLTVPLMLHNQVIGTFNVESPLSRAFTNDDLLFLEIYAGNVALALNTLNLLEAQGTAILQRGIEAIHRAVALPIDQILIDTVHVLESYQGYEPPIIDRLKNILRNARDIRQLIHEVGRGLAPGDVIPANVPAPRDFERVRVLVVDSDSEILERAHSILEQRDFVVETARTGAQALAMIRSCLDHAPYKIVITDLYLSDMNAYDLFVQWQTMLPGKVPLALMKGYGYDPGHVAVNCRKAGLHEKALVHRPFLVDQLLQVIETMLEWQKE